MTTLTDRELAAAALERLGLLCGLAAIGDYTPDEIDATATPIRTALVRLLERGGRP
jgi:hypothetical protein